MRMLGIRPGVFWALFVASVRMFVRNRAAVFFSLFLPLIIMLIFGVLNFEGSTTIQLGIVDDADTEISRSLVSAISGVESFEVTTPDSDEMHAALKAGDLELGLVIPAGWGQGGDFQPLNAFAATSSQQDAQIGALIVNSIVFRFAAGSTDLPASMVVVEQVAARDLGYIDFLVPGIVGMTVMQLGLFSVAFGFVQLKRTGALRRLFATPTSPVYFLGAQVASRLIIASFQVAILFGVGIWFGLQMFGDYASLAVIVLLGSVIFLAVGFAIAGWAKNEDQAAPVANLISLPMMFLSGVFFPRDAMPDLLASVTGYMPLTYVNEALRAIVNDGAGLTSLGPQLLGMGVWAVITFVLAVRLFRWE
jgi:ABC-2 type transport system permease protein